MRVTVANSQANAVAQLQQRQQQLVGLQSQITSGKRVERASDDPAAAVRAERALATQMRNEANLRALDASRNVVQQAESTLGQAGEMVQRAREMLLQAGNATLNADDRASIAGALRGLREDLLALANRGDGAGRYLFGGQGADQPPLRDEPGGVVFVGSAGLLRGEAGEPTLLGLDGRRIFLEVPDPASGGGGTMSLFGALDVAIGELGDVTRTGQQASQTVSATLTAMDAAGKHLSNWRSLAGETLNRIDALEWRIGQSQIDATMARSRAEDLDMIQAISGLQMLQTGYDAALQTYATVQRLSLFNYLR
jgi:flagellar hook-associated protein 3 FlgL